MVSELNGKDWLELPLDVMANIVSRISVKEVLENAQKVCTTWRKIIKDPATWRIIKMENLGGPLVDSPLKMYMHVVDLSEGQLVDVSIIDCITAELLLYIADRASKLKRLHIASWSPIYDSWPETLKKFPMLEELSLCLPSISIRIIDAASVYCPRLKTLKFNRVCSLFVWENTYDAIARIIGEHFPYLRHLSLIYNSITNIGLQVILDGCSHLESLDLRRCWKIELEGDLGKRCSKQIKYLRLRNDSLEDCPYMFKSENDIINYYEECLRVGPYFSDADDDSKE